MEQTNTKELIRETLTILKDKIAASYDSGSIENIDADVENIATTLSNMIEGLEELAFRSARSSEDDEQYTFIDYIDFKNTMNGK